MDIDDFPVVMKPTFLYPHVFCKRCGKAYENCPHLGTAGIPEDPTEPERIRAKYELALRFSPTYDTDRFTDGKWKPWYGDGHVGASDSTGD